MIVYAVVRAEIEFTMMAHDSDEERAKRGNGASRIGFDTEGMLEWCRRDVVQGLLRGGRTVEDAEEMVKHLLAFHTLALVGIPSTSGSLRVRDGECAEVLPANVHSVQIVGDEQRSSVDG